MPDLVDWPLLQGFVFGLALAMPVGPIGLLCIRRSLADGFATGFATGLGAATADAGYGAVAAFGLTAVSGALLAWQTPMALAGGTLLLWLGLAGLRDAYRPPESSRPAADKNRARSVLSAFLGTVVLTAGNPQTILTFVALFAGFGLGVGEDASWLDAFLLVLGVFAGSAAWWLVLAGGVAGLIRERLTPARLRIVNLAAGALITGFGVAALARGLGWI